MTDVLRVRGESATADLVRTMNWSKTPLGAIEDWPPVLLNAVNMVLNAPLPMQLFWGSEFICIYNDAMAPALSIKHPLSLGQPAETVWNEAWEVIGPQIKAVAEKGSIVSEIDFRLPLLKNGKLEEHYWTYSYSPLFDHDGSIVGVLDVAQDTTHAVLARMAEAVHRQSEELLRNFTSATSDVFYRMSADWKLMYQLEGRNFLSNTEKPDPEWLRKYIHPEDQPRVLAAIKAAIDQKSLYEFEHRVLRADGSLGWTFSRAIPILDDRGDITGWFGAATDTSAHKQVESALRQTEKLVAVGKLASTIAHEINNPLESVTNLLYLSKLATQDPSVIGYLDTAEIELRRIAVIANQTLRFHKQLSTPVPVSPRDIFEDSVRIYQGRLHNAYIRTRTRYRETQPVTCLEGEIRQVINNLIGNAIDAMKGGGTLHLRASEATDWITGRAGVRLTVADTGTGIERLTLRQIFQPFFTTKGINGTGLGLWISHEIVERHRGRLRVKSSIRRSRSGTVFTLFLPFEMAVF